MLEEVVAIVWVEERLDSIWTVGGSVGNVLWGIRKNENYSYLQVWNPKNLDFNERYLNQRFSDCKRIHLDSFNCKSGLIQIELPSQALETYFVETAKNL